MARVKTSPSATIAHEQQRICVVGSGTRFLSGISYYTYRLATALSANHRVSVILMRQLVPNRLYPGGRARIGAPLARIQYPTNMPVFDGIDWYWMPSLLRALVLLVRERPDVLLLHWWTGTVLHSYLALALVARLLGARVVIEYHEVMDKTEAEIPWFRAYVGLVSPLLRWLSSGFIAHSEHDRRVLLEGFKLHHKPVWTILHGSGDYHRGTEQQVFREPPEEVCNILYFGVVRSFKGLEDLVRAFEAIPESEIDAYWLTIVGEPWAGWPLPFELIARSPYRHRMTVVDQYVPEEDIPGYYAGADIVALPYHRASASGPLHVAMAWGVPVVTTSVGGLPEAVAGYEGARLVPPQSPEALRDALYQAAKLRGQRFADPHSWEQKLASYADVFQTMLTPGSSQRDRQEERQPQERSTP
jgi:glycosyltransferase involved in cell wall biosynthesis